MNKSLVKSEIDSLRKITPDSCYRSDLLSTIVLGRYHKDRSEFDEANSYFDIALKLAEKSTEHKLKKQILSLKAIILKSKGEVSKGRDILESAISIECHPDSTRCHKFDLSLLINKASFCRNLGEYETAIESYLLAKEIMEEKNFKDSLYYVSIYTGIGNIYGGNIADDQKALEYRRRAFALTPKNHQLRFTIYNNLGISFTKLALPDSALYYFNKTISESQSPKDLIVSYQAIGEISTDKKEYDKAIQFFNKAIATAKVLKQKQLEQKGQGLLGKAHYLNGDFKLANQQFEKLFKDFDVDEREEYEYEFYRRYSLLSKLHLSAPQLAIELNDHLLISDSIQASETKVNLEKSSSKFLEKILRDSIDREVLLKENAAQRVKNYRLSNGLLIAGVLLLASLVYQFRSLFVGQKEINEDLIFQNQELNQINQQLEQRNASLSVKARKDIAAPTIQYESHNNIVKIETSRVKYLKAELQGVRVYYDDLSNWTDMPLKIMNDQLPKDQFLLIYRGVMVNINHVERVKSTSLKLKDGTELKIGRTYSNKVKQSFMKL